MTKDINAIIRNYGINQGIIDGDTVRLAATRAALTVMRTIHHRTPLRLYHDIITDLYRLAHAKAKVTPIGYHDADVAGDAADIVQIAAVAIMDAYTKMGMTCGIARACGRGLDNWGLYNGEPRNMRRLVYAAVGAYVRGQSHTRGRTVITRTVEIEQGETRVYDMDGALIRTDANAPAIVRETAAKYQRVDIDAAFDAPGSATVDADIMDRQARNALMHGLTDRQSQIVDMLMQGYNQTDIAAALDISPSTVKTLVQRMRAYIAADARYADSRNVQHYLDVQAAKRARKARKLEGIAI